MLLLLLLVPSSEAVRLLSSTSLYHNTLIKKENTIFLIYVEIQMEAVAKSYMRGRGFLIYEEMRKYLVRYEEAAV